MDCSDKKIKKIVLHEGYTTLQFYWQFRSALLQDSEDSELVLYCEMKGRRALSECYDDVALRAIDIHDSPNSQGLLRKAVRNMSGFETW